MSGHIAVIIPAAGRSTRFGGLEKKPFVLLDGRAIWQRAAELFWTRNSVSRVYLVIPPEDREDFRKRFGGLVAFNNIAVVNGGAERFESVANALAQIPDTVEFVAVHDAVRPLTPAPLIDAVFEAARKHGAAMPALPVADTLKQVEPTSLRITGTIPRAGLWQAQTPQVFRRDWLVEAYARRAEHATPITDDAQLVEALGHSVYVVTGSPFNFKITTREDLTLAEAVLKSRGPKKFEARPSSGNPFDDEAKW
jgi:2-C-methyl-D-erythritol 4-phosphate cytidylyltransferase